MDKHQLQVSSKKRKTDDEDYDDKDASEVPEDPVSKKANANAVTKSGVVPPKVVKKTVATAATS